MEKARKKVVSEFHLLTIFTLGVLIVSLWFIATQLDSIGITGFSVSGYTEYSVYILDTYEGDDISFVIPVENKKDGIINKAVASVEVLDSNNQKVSSLETASISIYPGETKELKAVWYGGGSSGQYQARIMLFLDDESYSFSKLFTIEKKTITFESIIIDEFKLGETVNFSIVVQSHLEENLENVSAGILLLDDSGKTIAEIRSVKDSLEQKSLKKLMVNWDTKNIRPGTYNAKLVVNYKDRFIEKDLVLNIQEDSFEVIGIGYSISPRARASSKYSLAIMFLVIVLVLINISWAILYRRKTKRKKGYSQEISAS